MRTVATLVAIALVVIGVGMAFWLSRRTAKAPTVTSPSAETNRPTTAAETLETQAGELFSIVLDSNPTTGYQWEPEFDAEFLKLADRSYTSEAEPKLLGAGGQETFKFEALKAGATAITFKYLRSWEKEPIASRVYTVVIK